MKKNRNEVIKIKSKDRLNLKSLKPGVHKFNISIPGNPMGGGWQVPCVVIKGENSGATLGLTAALHGDELNGTNTIFKVLDAVSYKELSGAIVAIPISNVPGFVKEQREYIDGKDLNRRMPGKLDAEYPSDIYNFYFTSKIIKLFDYHLDLHTAGEGRVNSLYIRVDLEDEKCRELAFLQNPQIIVSKDDGTGTLRAWANSKGIPSITIEIGNPNTFQRKLIDETLDGVINTLKFHKMLDGKVKDYLDSTIICHTSDWINSTYSGITELRTSLTSKVNKGDVVAVIHNAFGDIVEQLKAPHAGIVIGMRTKPICSAGDRIIHLGEIGDISEE